jgi:hypothetical protein
MAARYSVLASRTTLTDDGATAYNDTIEGNVTFGITKKFHLASGLNIGKLTFDKNNDKNLYKDTLGIGVQTAFTYQFIKNLALELKFTMTAFNEEKDTPSGSVDHHASMKGGLLGLNGTF